MRHRRRTPARLLPALVTLAAVALAACGDGSATEAGVGPGAVRTDAPSDDATSGPVAAASDGASSSSSSSSGDAAAPASPVTTTGPAAARYRFVGTVLESAGAVGATHGPELCVGGVQESFPPQCGGVPVAGWSWEGVPGVQAQSGTTWADGLVVIGTWDGTTFTAAGPATAATPDDLAAGAPATDLSPACDQPTVGDPALLSAEGFSAAAATAGGRPDAAAVWVDDVGAPTDWVLNVEVTSDVAGAEAAIRQTWGGRLCLGLVPERPTAAQLGDIQARLPEVLGERVHASSPDTLAGRVEAEVLVASDDLQARADAAFGPGMVTLTGVLSPV